MRFSDGKYLKLELNLEFKDCMTLYLCSLYLTVDCWTGQRQLLLFVLCFFLCHRRLELTQYQQIHHASVQLSLTLVWVMGGRPCVLLTEENGHLWLFMWQLNFAECDSSQEKNKTKQNMPLHLIITFEIYWIKFGWKEHLIEHRLHMCRVKIIKNGRFVQFSEGQVNQLYLQHRINMTKWLAQWHSSSPKWFLAVSKHWNLITAILPESITQQEINFTSSA